MKRLALLLSLFVSTSLAFANVELGLNWKQTIFDEAKLDEVSSSCFAEEHTGSITTDKTTGFDLNFNFYPSEKKFSAFDLGWGMFFGYDVITRAKAKIDFYDYGFKTKRGTGWEMGFGFGPSFRYTLSDNFSLFCRPGIMTSWRWYYTDDNDGDYGENFYDHNTGVNVRMGGKAWVANPRGFHFGFEAGFDYTYVFLSRGCDGQMETISFDYDIKSRSVGKLYFGVVFNFGDRGYDRRGEADENN